MYCSLCHFDVLYKRTAMIAPPVLVWFRRWEKKNTFWKHTKKYKKIPLNKGWDSWIAISPDISDAGHRTLTSLLMPHSSPRTYLQISESWRAGPHGGNGRETCFTVHQSGRTQTDIPRGNFGPQARLICIFLVNTQRKTCVWTQGKQEEHANTTHLVCQPPVIRKAPRRPRETS